MMNLLNYNSIFRRAFLIVAPTIGQGIRSTVVFPAFKLWSQMNDSIFYLKNSPKYHGRLNESGDDLRERIR